METYYSLCFLAALAIGIAFIGQYIRRVQTTIIITATSLVGSLVLLAVGSMGWFKIEQLARSIVEGVNFQDFLLKGILGFLLFAGALGINLAELREQKWEITILSVFSTLLSTIIVGFSIYATTQCLSTHIPLTVCLLFGALISPTDPISVIAIIRILKAPRQILIQVEGESLFNDGIGLVIFVTLFSVVFGSREPSLSETAIFFLYEVIGGIIYGVVLGCGVHFMVKVADDENLEQLITLLVPTTGFAVANLLGISGALAMVVSGITVGNWTKNSGFSKHSGVYLYHFWEIIEQFCNAVLFLLIGLTILLIDINRGSLLLMALAIPTCLAARYVSLVIPFIGFRFFRRYNPYTVSILTWGGVRGGLALAMALSLPAGVIQVCNSTVDVRDLLLIMTYAVAMFSILVQGTTIGPLIRKANKSSH